ncbi:MAG: LysR family transcriptional regulator [Paracoccaceae bacterium]
MSNPVDWSLLNAFLAVAEEGSLSGAARRLGQSQPTLGRQIRQLEQSVGVTLFHRVPSGLEPTEQALPMIEAVRGMADSAARVQLLAQGGQTVMRGTVRVTASRLVSHHLLPPILATLRRAEPDIQIELVPSDTSENLLYNQADIALRMYPPDQLDLVARHVVDLPLGLYAAPSYLNRAGRPTGIDDLMQHDFVGYDRDERIIRMMRAMGQHVTRGFFPLRCDDQTVHWELVRAGCGIGGMQQAIAEHDPLVERILPDLPLPTLPLWLAAPEALRRNPRIRRVWDCLLAAFEAMPQASAVRPSRA